MLNRSFLIWKFAGSKERREIQDQLRKVGTLNWNMNAELNKGELMTSRRPKSQLNKEAADYQSCPYCFGSYAALRQHVALKYTKKPIAENEATKGERIITALSTSVEGRVHVNASKNLKDLFTTFRQHKVVRLIRFDWLIILFGNKICKKLKSFQKGLKRYRLRLAGRILDAIKSIEPDVTDFASIYQAKYYDSMVEAISIVSCYDREKDEFKHPACASSAVTLIRQIGLLLKSAYIKQSQFDKLLTTERFITVMDAEINTDINKSVTETQNAMRREKTVILPSTADVKLLAEYVDSERNSSFEELTSKYSFKTWKTLAETTMLSIIIFNRRRTGDIQNVLVAYFKKREHINEKSCGALFSSLNKSSKRVALQYSRMKIRAKKDSTVHVLLKPHVIDCIELLLTHRPDVGISKDNEYLFALPSLIDKDKTLNACLTMNKFANACGANNPSSLVGTNLRKHLATICMSMDLNDSVVADLAKFMGHAEKVHRDYYRQNTIDREVVQMSRLLEAALGNDDDDVSDTDDDAATSGTISKGMDASASVGTLQLKKKAARKRRNVPEASPSELNDAATTEGKSKSFKKKTLTREFI